MWIRHTVSPLRTGWRGPKIDGRSALGAAESRAVLGPKNFSVSMAIRTSTSGSRYYIWLHGYKQTRINTRLEKSLTLRRSRLAGREL